MAISTKKTDAIRDVLTRCVDEVIDRKDLELLLNGKRKLRVKLGIDPTSPNIHIGRAVILWKLRSFQDLGHTVIFIVGDFTGQIGDTSDKDSERPMLSESQIKINLKNYFDQAYKILDRKKTETYYNSKWLKKLGFLEIGKLADAFSLHEFESRELISKRMKSGKRVSLRELLYPLMQGYDSVAVKSDLELGGTDQRFNMLAGRTIQPLYEQVSQNIMTMQLVEGTDGRKMSSSWGNVINITDEPGNMFGKIMSVPDALIEKYFLFTTRLSPEEIKKILSLYSHPRDQKIALAESVTALYYGQKIAEQSKNNFISQFSKGQLPADIPIKKIAAGEYQLSQLLLDLGLVISKSEARRLMDQQGVKIDGIIVNEQLIAINGVKEILIQVGKRKFIKVK